MKPVYSLIAAAMVCASSSFGQQIINGSFESTKPDPGACNYFHNTGISTFTDGAVVGFGTADNIGYVDTPYASCNYGFAADGKGFLIISSNTTKFDAISLKLSSPLKANRNYNISFKHHGHPLDIDLGYSTSGTVAGTLIKKVPGPVKEDTIWKEMSYDFKPTMDCSWITVKVNLSQFLGYSFIAVDDFKLKFATGVDDIVQDQLFTMAPNPANNYLVLNTTHDGAVNLRITDMMGRNIQSGSYFPQQGNVKMDIADIANGMYLVHAQIGDQQLVQRLQILH